MPCDEVNLPGILLKMLKQQAEIAAVLGNHGMDYPAGLAEAAEQNLLDFRRFIGEYQITVKKRTAHKCGA